jgi:uncharacterized protein YoaH (UPF0181 family)
MVNIGSLPFDVQHLIFTYVDQQKKVESLTELVAFLMNKIEHLKSENEQLRQDRSNLSFILANDIPVARRLSFDSDWSDDTIIEISDIEDVDM